MLTGAWNYLVGSNSPYHYNLNNPNLYPTPLLWILWQTVISSLKLRSFYKIPKRWYTRPCKTRILCVTHTMSPTVSQGVKGAARVTMVTSGRYPPSYMGCLSHRDFKNITHVVSFGEFVCVCLCHCLSHFIYRCVCLYICVPSWFLPSLHHKLS